MTNYNDGKWHGWNGGECPVHPETVVECVYADGGPAVMEPAVYFSWYAIIAFRVIKGYKEPREWKLYIDEFGNAKSWCENNPDEYDIIHVREVIE